MESNLIKPKAFWKAFLSNGKLLVQNIPSDDTACFFLGFEPSTTKVTGGSRVTSLRNCIGLGPLANLVPFTGRGS